jgi:hypothetical protein
LFADSFSNIWTENFAVVFQEFSYGRAYVPCYFRKVCFSVDLMDEELLVVLDKPELS